MKDFQAAIRAWVIDCFNIEIANDKLLRNHRFLEEALELVQCCGMTQDEAHRLVDYVFDREPGKAEQEVGGTMTTLAALCGAHDIRLDLAAFNELDRIRDPKVMEKIRARQSTKPSPEQYKKFHGEPDIRL